MRNKEKIQKIMTVISKANKNFCSMTYENIKKISKRDINRLEKNFLLYRKALEDISFLIDGKKEIWAKCPYCGLKFTKVVKDTETKKSFWCEICKK